MITVSIVVHKTPRELLKSVLASLKDEPAAVIYVVDNSPEPDLEWCASLDSRIDYSHVENRGFGNAHNIAIRKAAAAGSDFHLVLNPDVRWNGLILQQLTEVMDCRNDCVLIQPRIVYPDGSLQHTCRLLPTPLDMFARRFLPKALAARRVKRYLLPDSAYDAEFAAPYMQGSFMLFRTSALCAEGLFDERFFMYPEDIDITRRLHRNHLTLYYPGVTIIHDHAASSQKFGRMMWIHISNMCRYFNKWGWFFDRERRRVNRGLLRSMKR